MRYAPTFILSLVCFVTGSLSVEAKREYSILPESFDTASTLEEAFAFAKQKNKPVILYYTRTRCPPCHMLQSRLRREDVAAPYRDGYVFTVVWSRSMGTEEREYYRTQYYVLGAPTWVVFDSRGDYVCTSIGGFKSDEGGKRLHAAIQSRLRADSHANQTGARDCIVSSN